MARKKSFRVPLKHVLPYLFILLGVWMLSYVPSEGLEGWNNIADDNFEIILCGTKPAGTGTAAWDSAFKYSNSTGSSVFTDLAVAGTMQDAEIQFPSTVTAYASTGTEALLIAFNTTWNELLSDLCTRVVFYFTWTDLVGVVNCNITSFTLNGFDTSLHVFQTDTFSATTEIQINDTSTWSYVMAWNQASLTTFCATYGATNVVVSIVFDNPSAYPFASEIIRMGTFFQYSSVSKAQTWLVAILVAGGFVMGTCFQLPLAGIMENPILRGKSHSKDRYRSKRRYRFSRSNFSRHYWSGFYDSRYGRGYRVGSRYGKAREAYSRGYYRARSNRSRY